MGKKCYKNKQWKENKRERWKQTPGALWSQQGKCMYLSVESTNEHRLWAQCAIAFYYIFDILQLQRLGDKSIKSRGETCATFKHMEVQASIQHSICLHYFGAIKYSLQHTCINILWFSISRHGNYCLAAGTLCCFPCSKALGRFGARHEWHVVITKYDGKFLLLHALQCLLPVFTFFYHKKTEPTEYFGKQFSNRPHVVHNKRGMLSCVRRQWHFFVSDLFRWSAKR